MKRIYLLGSLNIDLTIRAPRLPAAGETLAGGDFLVTPGGKGANQAYAAAALGGDVVMAGAVGSDAFAEILLRNLERAGANTEHIRKTQGCTGVAVITIVNGENRIILDAGANGEVTQADVDGLLADAWPQDVFLTQLETPLGVVKYALRQAREKQLFTVLNPAPACAEAADMVPLCDVITPNETELLLLTGERDPEAGCRKLLDMGAGAVLATLGKEGSLLVTKEICERIPAVRCGDPVDTTAAGDTYCGALCVKLAEGEGLPGAAAFASLCAGITVTRRGAQVSIPFRDEAEATAERLRTK